MHAGAADSHVSLSVSGAVGAHAARARHAAARPRGGAGRARPGRAARRLQGRAARAAAQLALQLLLLRRVQRVHQRVRLVFEVVREAPKCPAKHKDREEMSRDPRL